LFGVAVAIASATDLFLSYGAIEKKARRTKSYFASDRDCNKQRGTERKLEMLLTTSLLPLFFF
jgi:hypothetical protein